MRQRAYTATPSRITLCHRNMSRFYEYYILQTEGGHDKETLL